MNLRDITFSVNRYDCDGDMMQEGVFLHFGDCAVVKVSDSVLEFFNFVSRIKAIERELEGYFAITEVKE
jgi:hypothetical protein